MSYGQLNSDDFTLSHRTIRLWLICVFIVVILIAIFFPPAFWLCTLGGVLLVIGKIANSARTNQWWSWQHEGNLSWFEGWCVSTGALLVTVPLLTVLMRSLR
jgi:hypothetical protein